MYRGGIRYLVHFQAIARQGLAFGICDLPNGSQGRIETGRSQPLIDLGDRYRRHGD